MKDGETASARPRAAFARFGLASLAMLTEDGRMREAITFEPSCMMVCAEAQWSGLKSKPPVRGEAWFVGMPVGGRGMAAILAKAAVLYPTMFAAVDRIEESVGQPVLRLRRIEVLEDDVAHAGLSELRRSLNLRAQVCGMRIVAALNASRSEPLMHGMPLDRHPGLIAQARVACLLDELALIGIAPEVRSTRSGRL